MPQPQPQPRGCRPITEEEKRASEEGYRAFDPDKNCDDVNPYPVGDDLRVHFNIGWAWATDRWLDE